MEGPVERRLAAILAADVVGYSAMMERAEEATFSRWAAQAGRNRACPCSAQRSSHQNDRRRHPRRVLEPDLSRQLWH